MAILGGYIFSLFSNSKKVRKSWTSNIMTVNDHRPDDHFDGVHSLYQPFVIWNAKCYAAVAIGYLCTKEHVLSRGRGCHHMNIHLSTTTYNYHIICIHYGQGRYSIYYSIVIVLLWLTIHSCQSISGSNNN